ncbi:MAG: hypothetical protein ACREP9_21185, partial [Candidatus Dormibacteraceae bacterium]
MSEKNRPSHVTPTRSLEAWAKRFGPQYFAGTIQGRIIAFVCILFLVLLFGRNFLSHFSYSDLPITVIVIAAVGWSLGKRSLGAVSLCAVAIHLVETYLGHQGLLVAVVGVIGLPLVGITT